MDIEENIFSYVIVKIGTPVVRTGFSLERSRKILKALLNDKRICQLCTQICTRGFTPLKDLESDLTRDLHISEEIFSTTHEPVVCSSCLDSLNTDESFLESHSDIQGEIISTPDEKDGMLYVKTEEIEIKSDEGDFGNSPCCDNGRRAGQTSRYRQVTDNPSLKLRNTACTDSFGMLKYQCVICAYTTPDKGSFDSHLLNHPELLKVKIFQCDRCNFVTKHKQYLAKHQLVHKDIREVEAYSCDLCRFQTKYKNSLIQHKKRRHRNGLEG